MKKSLFIFAWSLLGLTSAFGEKIPLETAKQVALSFYTQNTSAGLKSSKQIILNHLPYEQEANRKKSTAGPETLQYYIFNVNDNDGFIIVSAYDNVEPILGYSFTGTFVCNNMPNLLKWLDRYKKEIDDAVKNDVRPSQQIAENWIRLKNNQPSRQKSTTAAVTPLIKTKWAQSPLYNAKCPLINGQPTQAGSVATAMAQIMKYWRYPQKGISYHQYFLKSYGYVAANMGAKVYNWDLMPDTMTAYNDEIITLMYHCGVSVEMQYAVNGSRAHIIQGYGQSSAASALKKYFGYDKDLMGIERRNYADENWRSLLKSELQAGRPILYGGIDLTGGHAFIIDGFDESNRFSVNWGWGGASDGYFLIDNLNPSTFNYTSNQVAVIGIKTPADGPRPDMFLYDSLTPSPNPVLYGSSFTVHTNIMNYGGANFSGDLALAAWDEYYFVTDMIGTKSGISLPSGDSFSLGLDFVNPAGNIKLWPGKYYLMAYYKPTGGEWDFVKNNFSYLNYREIEIKWTSDLELYDSIEVQGDIIIQGEPVTVQLDVRNALLADFTGSLQLALYDVISGELVTTIEEKNDLNLCGLCNFTEGLTFSNPGIDIRPGLYLLALWHKSNSGSYKLSGSSYYRNPVKVMVQAKPVEPDEYEVNDALSTASAFTPEFINDTFNLVLSNLTIHDEGDADYFSIPLHEDFDYFIDIHLKDQYTDTGQSCDMIWAYFIDGNRSEIFDDVSSKRIKIKGGEEFHLFTSPYYAGMEGNYSLELTIKRETKRYVIISEPALNAIWATGTDQTIRWESNVPGELKIELIKDGVLAGTIVEADSNSGEYQISIWNQYPSFYYYQVVVTSIDDPTVADTSDYFSIRQETYLIMISPRANTTWYLNDTMAIEWTTNVEGNIRIELRYNTNERGSIIYSSAENTGTFEWRIGRAETPGNKYEILLMCVNNQSMTTWSGYFTIAKETDIKDEPEDERISVYPNPVSHELLLDFGDQQGSGRVRISLFNLLGQAEFFDQYEISTGNDRIVIPLANVPPGLYILNVELNDTRYRRVVVKK